MNKPDCVIARAFAALALTVLLATASAQTIDPAFTADYSFTDLGSVPSLPSQAGGLVFKKGDPNTILIGGAANGSNSKIYSIGVVRDVGGHITGFSGTAAYFADATGGGSGGIDGGLDYGPNGVLFYATFPDNYVGELKPGSTIPDKLINLTPLDNAGSTGAICFVPPGFPGAGHMKILSYSSNRWFDSQVAPDGNGTFDIVNVGPPITMTGAGGLEGAIYVPSGSPDFPQSSILVASYTTGRIVAYDVDANGDPLVNTVREFMNGLSGALGAVIDPVTHDFLFATFGGGNRVIVVHGFAALPFHDAFTGGPSPLWDNAVGNWAGTNDAYAAQAPSVNPLTYTGLPFIVGDGTVLVDVQQLQDGGVWLHSTDNQNGVLLVTGGDGGTGTGLYWATASGGVLDTNINEVGGLFTPGVSNAHLRIEMRGDTYSVYVDGSSTPATTFTTNAFPSGRVGLYDYSAQTFDNFLVTAQFAPSVTTDAPTDTTLNGTVNPNGSDTTAYFEYGADTSYGSTTPPEMLGNGNGDLPLNFNLTGLAPHGVVHYRVVASNIVDAVHGEDQTLTIPNSPPVAVHDHLVCNGTAASLDPTVNDIDADLDTLTVTDFSQGAFGAVTQVDNTLTYTPGPDYSGYDSFTYTIDDGFGGSSLGVVIVNSSVPLTHVLYVGAKDGTGTAVPDGAGGSGGSGTTGETFVKFGIPSINGEGDVAFNTTFKLTKGQVGVFDGRSIVAQKGDAAAGLSGVTYAGFKDPALGEDGSVAFLASLKGAVTSSTNQGLFTNFGGTFQLVLQKGAAAPGISDATIKAIKSYVLTSTGIFYLAALEGSVTSADDAALWYWTPDGGPVLELRKGQPLNGKTVKSFVALKSSGGSSGQGRSTSDEDVLVRVSYSDGTQQLVLACDGDTFDEATGTPAPDLTNAAYNKFGVPIINHNGYYAFLASLTGVPSASNKGIFVSSGFDSYRVAGRGDVLGGLTLNAFKDPVFSNLDDVAALCTLATTSNKTAIVYVPGYQHGLIDSPTILARVGDHPPGTPGGVQWRAFKSLALPDVAGPVFVATLAFSPGLVDGTNDVGLWALDANGVLHLLVREGDQIGGKTVKLFTVLKAVGGSPDQTRAFNGRQIVYRATFTDGTSAIVRVDLPTYQP